MKKTTKEQTGLVHFDEIPKYLGLIKTETRRWTLTPQR